METPSSDQPKDEKDCSVWSIPLFLHFPYSMYSLVGSLPRYLSLTVLSVPGELGLKHTYNRIIIVVVFTWNLLDQILPSLSKYETKKHFSYSFDSYILRTRIWRKEGNTFHILLTQISEIKNLEEGRKERMRRMIVYQNSVTRSSEDSL